MWLVMRLMTWHKIVMFWVCQSEVLMRSTHASFLWLYCLKHQWRVRLSHVPFIIVVRLLVNHSQLSSNFRKEVLFTLDEKFMLKALLVFFVSWLVKVVHVKLAHEWAEIVMFEVLRQDILGKSIRVFHDEAVSFLVPKYGIWVRSVLNVISN